MSRWLLELQADSGGDVPPEIRLRRLLKFAGRTCRLRCVAIRPADSIDEKRAAPHDQSQGSSKEIRGRNVIDS